MSARVRIPLRENRTLLRAVLQILPLPLLLHRPSAPLAYLFKTVGPQNSFLLRPSSERSQTSDGQAHILSSLKGVHPSERMPKNVRGNPEFVALYRREYGAQERYNAEPPRSTEGMCLRVQN